MVEVVKLAGRRALDVAAERWQGRASVRFKTGEGWKRAAATALWCFSCNTRVALSAMRDHILGHMRRKR